MEKRAVNTPRSKPVFHILLFFALLASLLGSAVFVTPAYAAGIIVNSNADDTLTNLDANATCDLREAITNANNDAATYADCDPGTGNDTITFAGNYTITLTSSLPDVTDIDGLTITGNGTSNTIIQAAGSAGTATYRIIKVNGVSVSATLEYMTLRYGVEASGGAINVASSALTLNNVTISDNQVDNSLGTGLNGGAISINSGSITINNSTISGNGATSSDTSKANGGGIFVGGSAIVYLNNSTISGNSAAGGGGGLYTNGGTINVSYSTIANNTSDSDNDAIGDGGGINRSLGTINLKSSIVAGNQDSGSTTSATADCSGTITSQGYNLTGTSTGCPTGGTGDTTVTPSTVFTAVLGALADNGGQTYTHALITGSGAVNAIASGTNSCGTDPFDEDQRGGARPYSSNCDMGAYELKTIQSVSTTGVDSGDCTLTDCLTIAYAYGKSQAGNTINVAAGTYTETSGYDITKNLTISGAGATSTIVQAAASPGVATHRFYKVNAAGITVNIQNLTLRYGVEASGGALNVAAGTLNLTNVVLSDNQVNNSVATGLNGGALSVNGGTANITNSAIINNSVTTNDTSGNIRGSGGGVFLGSTGTITLNNTTISGNSSIRGGGGLFTNGGTININYSTIANNTSDNADVSASTSVDGGGINRNSGTLNLKSSIVAGNKKGLSSPADNDCSGTISSQGYNLTGSSAGCSLAGTGDVTVTPSTVFTSVLGSLADNGGSTYTHLLYGGNAAQDAIPNGTNSCGSGTFAADQLGNIRPYNTNCDMGAYESQNPAPTVSMSSTAGDPTNTSPIPVTVTFSESVTNFTFGDITVANAMVDNFSGSGAAYSFDLTPSGDGTVTADIAAGVAQDSVYNVNTAATQFSRSYDGTAPTVTGFAATTPINSLNIPITIFTATDTIGVTAYLITTTNTTPSAGDSGWTGSAPSTYTVASNGSYTLYPWAKDAAGNVSALYGSPASVTVDTTAPTVSSSTRASSTPTNASSVDFLVGFSESGLTGIDTSDFTLTTTGSISGASVTNVSPFAAILWTVTVNTGSGDGTIRLDLSDDDTIADAAGNKLGGTGTGNGDFTSGQTYTVEKTAPTVDSFAATSPTTNLNIPITLFTASDNTAVSGYLITETSTAPGAGDSGWTVSAPSDYSVGSLGTYSLYPWAKDAAGNVSAVYGSPASVSVCANAITVTSNADSGAGTLRQAIADACAGGTIDFDSALSGDTIYLASTLTITKNLTIDGSALASALTISGDTDNNGTANVQIFFVNGVLVATLNSLTITKGIGGANGGGGIFNNTATLTIMNSTLSDNTGNTGGGGIYNTGVLVVTNSTFSGNFSGSSSNGGGILNIGTLTITNSTLSGNSSALSGDGIYNYGTLNYANTIIANSTTGGDCVNNGTIGTNTNNLVEDGSCSASVTGDPNLDTALANNGGPTQTFALLTGSIAINAGDDATCAAAPVSNTSQNGITRPQGAHCDIGSYEVDVPATQSGPDFVVNVTDDTDDGKCDLLGQGSVNRDCTLREAINAANNLTPDAAVDTITFDNALATATITLTSDLPDITDEDGLTINGGADITIDGDDLYRPFYACGCGALTLDSLTVTHGNASGDYGGALANNGANVTITNSTFSYNSAYGSGAIDNFGGVLTITNSSFSNNTATDAEGGAIANLLSGTLTVTNVSFSDNTAANYYGGAIANDGGDATITNSAFTNNSAYGSGAIDNDFSSTLEIANSTFSGNTATDDEGGAIGNYSGALTITNSTFSGNTATSSGGIFNEDTLYLYNTILANSASGADCFNNAGTVAGNNNLIKTDGSGANACGTTAPINNTDPLLGSLANNGGLTQTLALLAGSPAIDAGDNTICMATPVSGLDQRGYSRDASCDIGAYEANAILDATSPTVDTFTATSPSSSLDIPITAFTASDNVLVSGYLITETSTAPSAGASGWSGSAPTTYTVASDGSYNIRRC